MSLLPESSTCGHVFVTPPTSLLFHGILWWELLHLHICVTSSHICLFIVSLLSTWSVAVAGNVSLPSSKRNVAVEHQRMSFSTTWAFSNNTCTTDRQTDRQADRQIRSKIGQKGWGKADLWDIHLHAMPDAWPCPSAPVGFVTSLVQKMMQTTMLPRSTRLCVPWISLAR